MMGMRRGRMGSRWLGLAVAVWALGGIAAQAELRVEGLRCEYQPEPLGIDTPQPRLSWRLESAERGQAQTAYQVLAAAEPQNLVEGKADLWDADRSCSFQSLRCVYAGKPLRSGQRVYLKVRALDK